MVFFLKTPTFLMAAGRKTSILSYMLGCSHVVSWDGRVLKSHFYGQMSPVCRMQDSDSLSFLGILKDFTNSFWRPSSRCQIPDSRTAGSLGHYEFHSAPLSFEYVRTCSCVQVCVHVCTCSYVCKYMCVYACTPPFDCRGQTSTSSTTLKCHPPWVLRQGLLPGPELADSAKQAASELTESACGHCSSVLAHAHT